MKRWIIGLGLVLALTAAAACNEDPTGPSPIKFDGEIRELALPGPSAWVIDRLDADITYYPLNLPSQYEVEGMQVDVEALLIHDYTVFPGLDLEPIEIQNIVEITPL
jgi:hypothetical protein